MASYLQDREQRLRTASLGVTPVCPIRMDPEHSTPRPKTSTCRPQTAERSKQGGDIGSHRCLEQFTSETVEELGSKMHEAIYFMNMDLLKCLVHCHKAPLEERDWRGQTPLYNAVYYYWLEGALLLVEHGADVQELESKVHEAISQKNMDWLKCLVHCHKAALEERNEQGLTPLYNAVYYNWLDGAFFLLEHGANVHNAESRPENLLFSHKPLMHLAVKTGSQRLVQELIKSGASIRVRDSEGAPCVNVYGDSALNILFEWLGNSVTEEGSRRTDLLKDLLFIVSTAAQHPRDLDQVEKFISRQPSCHQKKMLQVCGACVCSTHWGEIEALHYWKMSAECLPCEIHDHKVEEEMAPKSVFADILSVKEHPLPDTVTTDDDKLAIDIHALLLLEKCMPEHIVLIDAGARLRRRLLFRDEIVTALGVLWRLTTIRPLYENEVDTVRDYFESAVECLEDTEELPFSAVMDSMKTIQYFLSSLNVGCSQVQPAIDLEVERHLESTCQWLFEALLQSMKYCYGQEVVATPEQLEDFTSHVKEILRRFPSACCQDAFHLLAWNIFDQPGTASMIKDLVTYSAEISGTVRQKNFPLHLLSDSEGDTPLHRLAREISQEDLVQGGVLQCFVDHGADLCTRNNEGETVRRILVERRVYTEGELLPSLQCLAAAAFMGDRRLRHTVQNCRPAAVRNFLLDH